MSDLISIIVPVYNVEAFLVRCVESVLNQTYKNLEIILVDDGSPDKCPKICDDYAAKDKRIKVIHQTNKGVSVARNAALEIATGSYVAFVDGDDQISPDAIEILHSAIIDDDNVDAAIGRYLQFKEESELQDKSNSSYAQPDIVEYSTALKKLLYQSIENAPGAKLYKHKLFEGIRFDPKITHAEDLYINYQLITKANKVALIGAHTYFYLMRQDNATNTKFSPNRMSGLKVAQSILKDALLHEDAAISRAAKNRVFMEALFIMVQIPSKTKYRKDYEACNKIIADYANDVARDPVSRTTYRVYAITSKVSIPFLIKALRLKARIFS